MTAITSTRSLPPGTARGGKRRRPEQALHLQCARWLDAALAREIVWFHVPNGGWRTRVEAARFRALGVKAGVPDILIVCRGRLIAVELKAEGGRLTQAQREIHNRLALAGAVVHTVRSLDGLRDFIRVLNIPLREAAP